MKINKVEFSIFNTGSEYVVKRLANDDLSIDPSFFRINISDLNRVFGINEEKITYIPLIDGFTKFKENNSMQFFQTVHVRDKFLKAYDLTRTIDYLTEMNKVLKFTDKEICLNSENHKIYPINKIASGSDSFVYREVEYWIKQMLKLCDKHPDEALWEFSISGFRKFRGLNKGKEAMIKESLRKIGIHLDDHRTKFVCRLSLKQTHTIRYYISVGELRSIYDPFYEKLELTTAI